MLDHLSCRRPGVRGRRREPARCGSSGRPCSLGWPGFSDTSEPCRAEARRVGWPRSGSPLSTDNRFGLQLVLRCASWPVHHVGISQRSPRQEFAGMRSTGAMARSAVKNSLISAQAGDRFTSEYPHKVMKVHANLVPYMRRIRGQRPPSKGAAARRGDSDAFRELDEVAVADGGAAVRNSGGPQLCTGVGHHMGVVEQGLVGVGVALQDGGKQGAGAAADIDDGCGRGKSRRPRPRRRRTGLSSRSSPR